MVYTCTGSSPSQYKAQMKKILLTLILLLGTSLTAHAEEYVVKSVLEGDRILLTNGKTVQFLGIDAAKKKPAREFLAQLVQPGQKVELDIHGPADSEVVTAYVYTTLNCDGKGFASIILHGAEVLHDAPHEKSVFLNGEILKKGHAMTKTDGLDPLYAQMFLTLARQAKEERLGIWDDGTRGAPVSEKNARDKEIEQKEAQVKGMITKYRQQESVKTASTEKTSAIKKPAGKLV